MKPETAGTVVPARTDIDCGVAASLSIMACPAPGLCQPRPGALFNSRPFVLSGSKSPHSPLFRLFSCVTHCNSQLQPPITLSVPGVFQPPSGAAMSPYCSIARSFDCYFSPPSYPFSVDSAALSFARDFTIGPSSNRVHSFRLTPQPISMPATSRLSPVFLLFPRVSPCNPASSRSTQPHPYHPTRHHEAHLANPIPAICILKLKRLSPSPRLNRLARKIVREYNFNSHEE
jgi:hypothetical protein